MAVEADKPVHYCECRRLFGLHPVTWLLGWGSLAAIIPWLAWPYPAWLFAGCMGLLLIFRVSPFLALCYRSRFLLLMTVIVYGWRTPGRLVWPLEAGFWSKWLPTWEGLSLAWEQLIFLLLLLSLAAIYLKILDIPQWIGGLYRLTRWLPGLNAERAAVRFMLVLEALGKKPTLSYREFWHLLKTPNEKEQDTALWVLTEPMLRWRDWGIIGFIIMLPFSLGMVFLWS